ncbi:MAG: flagellar protein FlaG [Lachnospiraceae bacterium]|nr:flagellar protein FlaG [Lachnospiraceae bacterium]
MAGIEPIRSSANVQVQTAPSVSPVQSSYDVEEKTNETAQQQQAQVQQNFAAQVSIEKNPDEMTDEQIAKQNEAARKSIEQINKTIHNSTLKFGYHEQTHRITLKILDEETKKVIKEVPAEKTLDMIAKAWELAGLMVDEKR